MITAMPAATSVYKALVRLYPPAFRREFGPEMACDFEDATREAWREGRWLAVATLWLHLARDFVTTVAAEWLRNGLPLVAAIATAATTMLMFGVTSLLWREIRFMPVGPESQDEAVLLFLATMVILIAVTVIMFTVCFSLLITRRRERPRRV